MQMAKDTGLDFTPKLLKAVSLKKRTRDMDVERLSKILVFFFDNPWEETVEYAKNIGFLSVRKTPYTLASLRFHLNKFMVRHPEVIRDLMIEHQNKYPRDVLGDNDWLEFIVSFATRYFKGKPEFIRWAVNNGYYKPGFDIFKDIYNLTENDRTAFD